jgi:hypothetical protein
MRIGASRQKYSPWLIIHFGRTETTTAESAVDPWDPNPLPEIPTTDSYTEQVIFLAHFDEDISVSMVNGVYTRPFSDASLHKRLLGIQWISDTNGTATVTVGALGKFSDQSFATGYLNCTGHADSFDEGGMIVVVPGTTGPHATETAQFDSDTAFTMEGYVYPVGYKKATAFGFYTKTTQNDHYLEVGMNTQGEAQVVLANEWAANYYTLSTVTALTLNTWSHLACVREVSGTISLYINGLKQTNTLYNGTTVIGDFGRLVIGGNRDQGLRKKIWNGGIDEVRFTANVARYTTSFSPLTARFPNP